MATTGRTNLGELQITQESTDRLKLLYPAVNEEDTPIPRSWSPKDKFNFIGLSQNNLRAHYKGVGKTPKDAASVRATHPIPVACGVYYFEVKIISKGRDGFMGIGLSAQGVNMNSLPGWQKHSYGYHGDDGNSFCSSGTGQFYGPTFTTGDVIGCCVNLIDSTCFYTKNGVNLGVAFTDLPAKLYPTIGLQTPGEVVEANFGQSPFIFDIEDYMKEWRMKTKLTVERFPVTDRRGEWQTALQQIVSTYLVHHGYCSTAEAFARATGQPITEEITSIKNRQRIQRLVLAGRIGEAIEATQQLYPGLLERSPNLLFTLKCRQFIEMVNGTDSEVRGAAIRSPKSCHNGNGSNRSSPNMSPVHLGGSQLLYSQRTGSRGNSPSRASAKGNTSQNQSSPQQNSHSLSELRRLEEQMNSANSEHLMMNGTSSQVIDNDDVEMSDGKGEGGGMMLVKNGNSQSVCMNGSLHECHTEDMEVDSPSNRRQLCGGSQTAVEKMLRYGRELQATSLQLRREFGKNEANKKALQDAFSLLAYSDPWSSPVGYQLQPVQRESVCAALNSAILESNGLPKQPPLEVAIAHATQCMKLMSKESIGTCAFTSVSDYLH
ncbi:ran-binding protein 9-like [Gigantopelta aegis]|uniref:ran-binding protein 9-like n=1 Tax=Gigantopelta aegis TaxID=1735272 RepID=UPI001B88B32E|nr:ran-binding protein 9-like [Gigantopelta aegis]